MQITKEMISTFAHPLVGTAVFMFICLAIANMHHRREEKKINGK